MIMAERMTRYTAQTKRVWRSIRRGRREPRFVHTINHRRGLCKVPKKQAKRHEPGTRGLDYCKNLRLLPSKLKSLFICAVENLAFRRSLKDGGYHVGIWTVTTAWVAYFDGRSNPKEVSV